MKFKMNDITYVIKEVSQKEYKELRVKEDEEDDVEISDVKNGIYQGSTHHTKGIVYIDKNLPHEIKRKTLIHELTHCYIREYITHEEKTYSEEMVADRLAGNWNLLKRYIKETKLEEFEKSYGKRYGKTFTQAEIVVCNMILDKIQELEQGSDSNEI